MRFTYLCLCIGIKFGSADTGLGGWAALSWLGSEVRMNTIMSLDLAGCT